MSQVENKNRITTPVLTKYEMTNIISMRTKMLQMGCKPFIEMKNKEQISFYNIAKEELKRNKLPFKIKRNLPNGDYELWKISELNNYNILK